jgi:succinate dehydrogenase flavin-adding protein (antitoxin of CptAB toxin-antitoxin module)
MVLRIVFASAAFAASLFAHAQYDCDSTIFISGKVLNEAGNPLYDAMVVNRTQSVGQFCEADGSYLMRVCPSDTIQFAATGYASVRISYADSAYRSQYTRNVRMRRLRISIPEVEVLAPRDLEKIYKDIETLGFEEKDYRVAGIDAARSPITYLYQTFSRREQSKRKAIELRNNDRRRALLKELFSRYAEYEIIQLEDDEFDDFIDFMDPGDERLQSFTQYGFILYVKDRYEAYKKFGRSRELEPSDHQYHLDD